MSVFAKGDFLSPLDIPSNGTLVNRPRCRGVNCLFHSVGFVAVADRRRANDTIRVHDVLSRDARNVVDTESIGHLAVRENEPKRA